MYKLLSLVAFFALSLNSLSSEGLLTLFSDQKPKGLPTIFHGLRFFLPAGGDCKPESINLMRCTILSEKNQGYQLTLQFEKKTIVSKASLPLLGLLRKERWQEENPSNNQVIERDYRAGAFMTRLQQYRYFLLDNIFRPVLIRAFDIVVNETTIITVFSRSDANEWPFIQAEIENIELSFSRAVLR